MPPVAGMKIVLVTPVSSHGLAPVAGMKRRGGGAECGTHSPERFPETKDASPTKSFLLGPRVYVCVTGGGSG